MACTPDCTVTMASYHCARCHVTYGTLTHFDAHHSGGMSATCQLPVTLALTQDAKGIWRTSDAIAKQQRAYRRLTAYREANPEHP